MPASGRSGIVGADRTTNSQTQGGYGELAPGTIGNHTRGIRLGVGFGLGNDMVDGPS